MKVYRFGDSPTVCYNIIIIEDSGEIRITTVGLKTIKEEIATIKKCGNGIERLLYGTGSSMPYKNSEGELCEKYSLVYEE